MAAVSIPAAKKSPTFRGVLPAGAGPAELQEERSDPGLIGLQDHAGKRTAFDLLVGCGEPEQVAQGAGAGGYQASLDDCIGNELALRQQLGRADGTGVGTAAEAGSIR